MLALQVLNSYRCLTNTKRKKNIMLSKKLFTTAILSASLVRVLKAVNEYSRVTAIHKEVNDSK